MHGYSTLNSTVGYHLIESVIRDRARYQLAQGTTGQIRRHKVVPPFANLDILLDQRLQTPVGKSF
jgi:hypothetical protein